MSVPLLNVRQVSVEHGADMKYGVMIACLIYNLCILTGATYLIVFYDWSLWMYVVAALFMLTVKDME